MPSGGPTLSIDQQALVNLRKALSREADGKKLKRELATNLRRAVAPAVVDAKTAVKSLPAVQEGSPPLRDAVAGSIKAQVRFGGKSPGVRVAQGSKGMPRGFAMAGRRLNQAKGWRHPVFGRDVWVVQRGRQWFEPALKRKQDEYKRAVVAAMNDMAERIARGARTR